VFSTIFMPKLIHFRLLATVVPLLCAFSFPAKAQSSASGSISLNSLTVTPVSGDISWSGWALTAVSTTLNSDGGLDPESNFGTSPGSVSAISSVPYASANTLAAASSLDASGISGHAAGSVLIPGGINESASVSGGYGNFASLETTITLSQDSSVSFGAGISAAQSMQTDAYGQVLENEVTFNLNVSGTPTLFYDNAITLGPNGTLATSATPTLNDSINLTAGTYDLYIELDDEQQVLETPDEGQTCLLLLLALSLLASARAMGGRGSLSR
jgi:hypothetical protein